MSDLSPPAFSVDLPGGGQFPLNSAEEVEAWQTSAKRYIEDYGLVKQNDLVLLGAILTQQIIMYRAQLDLADEQTSSAAQGRIIKASEEIRNLEKALGIDKKTREAGGQHTVSEYLTRLKRAAHMKGIHISDRVISYEGFVKELSWRVRLLENGDDEDAGYHGLSDRKLIEWIDGQLAELNEADKEWSREKGAVFVGRL